MVVPPPTGLTRALDAVVDAWATDLAKLGNARDRAKRLKTRTDRQSRRIAHLRGRVTRLRSRLDELTDRQATLRHRLATRVSHRIRIRR
jgi:predicted nuclease with TOPRIM domain